MNNPAGGWIKLHRKLLNNPLTSRPAWAWLWVYLLLKASHEENSIIWNKKPLVIKRGQLLTGRNTMSKETGVTAQSIRSCLDYLKSTNQVTIQTSNKWSIITICNYEQYQEVTNEVTNEQPTNNQPVTTYKNDKKVKNDKKDNIIDNVLATKVANLNEFMDLFKGVNPNYERLFANKTQRGALERMILKYGEVKMRNMLTQLPSIVCKPYAPQISTPVELENKLGKLVQFMSQEKLKVSKTGTTKI